MKLLPLVTTLMAVFSALSAQTTDPYPPSPVPDRIMLNFGQDPSRAVSVTWRTDVSVKGARLEIAEALSDPTFHNNTDTVLAFSETLKSNRNVAIYHSVSLIRLKPDTKYAYRVGDGKNYSEWLHFTTASDKSAPFSFIYFGDAQNKVKSYWSRCIREAILTAPDFDFMVHAGDLINVANRDEEWGEWFYAGGWIYGMKPSIVVPGNHEYYRFGRDRLLSEHWRPTFTLPRNGPEGMEETVYYVDYQDTRFITLNTMPMLQDEKNLERQEKWLKAVLKNNDKSWTVVIQHHPIYSTAAGRDNEELRKAFQPLFEEYGVDIVLQGHDHTYGRGHNVNFGQKNDHLGPVYVVSVSGPKMYTLNFEEWLERVASNTQLYQIIEVDGNRLNYKAYTATGKLYDEFELRKRGNGKNRFLDLAPSGVRERADLSRRYMDRMTDEEIQIYQQRYEQYMNRKKN